MMECLQLNLSEDNQKHILITQILDIANIIYIFEMFLIE